MTTERSSTDNGVRERVDMAPEHGRGHWVGEHADALPFPLLTLDADGTIQRANAPAREALGLRADDQGSRSFTELVGRSWQGAFRTALDRALKTAGRETRPPHTSIELPLQTSAGEGRFGLLLAAGGDDSATLINVLLYPVLEAGNQGLTLHTLALEATGDAILCTDLDGRILYYNGRFCELWKIPNPAKLGDQRSLFELAKDQLEDPESLVEPSSSSTGQTERETRQLLDFRDRRTVEQHTSPLTMDGLVVGHVLSFRDVTRQQRARETIRSSERRYRLLFERNVAGVFRASPDGEILEVNDAFARLVGYDTPIELQGKSLADFYASLPERRRFGEELERSGAVANREVQFARKDGSTIWVLENSILVDDAEIMGPVIEGTIVDITARKRLETELERMAYHDPLTDLANRRLLEERARMTLAFADRHGIQAGLVYLDLSRFKRINDTLGHEAGDEVLVEVSNRIRECLRGSDTAARIGGDEFACLLAEVGGERGAMAVAQRISDKLGKPFELGDRTLHIDAQIGVSMYPDHAADFEDLLAAADRAMYRTKEDGNPAIEIYSAEMDESPPDEIAEEEELREAIERAQLCLHYQPVVRASDGRIVGAEALVRWRHPSRGLLEAAEFIQVAEQSDVIRKLDRWVLEEAFRQAAEWERREIPEWVSVNQSIRTLRDPGLTDFVEDLLRRSRVPAGRIVLEVNEGAAVRSPEAVAKRLSELRKLGIRIALDDFGTGQSTLADLKHFPADIVKLDGFFVHDLGTNHDSRNLVKAVIQMGQALGVSIIAERVETEAQCEWLRSAGCDFVQGYHTGRPVSPERLQENMDEQRSFREDAIP